jgi:hypothetical protein
MHVFDRYLITMKGTLPRLEYYLKAVSRRTISRALGREGAVLEEVFPQLAVIFTKSLPDTRQFDMHHIFIDVAVTVRKPVSMHIVLQASTTSDTASETVFLGTNVLPCVPRHGPRYCERISQVKLAQGGYIRRSSTPVLFPADSGAVHKRNPDFKLSLHLPPRYMGDRELRARPLEHTKETFEALFAALPARKEGYDLCRLKIDCKEGEIDTLCGAVSTDSCFVVYHNSDYLSRSSLLCRTMSKSPHIWIMCAEKQ